MSRSFEQLSEQINTRVEEWEATLLSLPQGVIEDQKNSQNRNIKQILGHLVDSASNNQQRMVRLQYSAGKELNFPDYTRENDLWIAIQNYKAEEWSNLVSLWASFNRHIAHLVKHIDSSKADNFWIDSDNNSVTLQEMAHGYVTHLRLHLQEINALTSLV